MVVKANRIDPKTDPKVYEVIIERYSKFLENLDVPDKPVIRVFDPLPQKHLSEIELLRECTKTLQQKKEDDMRRAKEQAEEAKQAAIEAKKEEASEEKKEEAEVTEVTEENK